MGFKDKSSEKNQGGKEIKDYGYGGHVDTDYLTGKVTTTIYTGPMDASGNSPHIKTSGRGPY